MCSFTHVFIEHLLTFRYSSGYWRSDSEPFVSHPCPWRTKPSKPSKRPLEELLLGPDYRQACDWFPFDPLRKRIICSLAKGKQTSFSSSVAKNVGVGGSCCSLGWGIGGTLRTAFPSTNERVSSLPLEVTESQVFVFPARDLGHMTPCRWVFFVFSPFMSLSWWLGCRRWAGVQWDPRK